MKFVGVGKGCGPNRESQDAGSNAGVRRLVRSIAAGRAINRRIATRRFALELAGREHQSRESPRIALGGPDRRGCVHRRFGAGHLCSPKISKRWPRTRSSLDGNPTPEIMPDAAAPYVGVIAPAFGLPQPGQQPAGLPGHLPRSPDVRAARITEKMKLAAAGAIAPS